MEKAKDLLKSMTLYDVMNSGASIDIHFHFCGNMQEALDKVSTYKTLGFTRNNFMNNTRWLEIDFEDDQFRKLSITAFYDVGGDNND